MTAALWVTVALAAAPKVLIAEGEHPGVPPARLAEVMSDVRARCSSANLEPTEPTSCPSATRCLAKAEAANAAAFIIVSMIAGPKVITVDLDARRADGTKLDVLTVNLAPAAHALPEDSASFFERIAKAFIAEEPPPVVVSPPVPKEPANATLVIPAQPSVRSRAWVPLLPAAAFAVGGAALLINAAVIDGQLRGDGGSFVADPTQTSARVNGAVNEGKWSQGLGYTAVAFAVGCVAIAAVMYLFGAPATDDAEVAMRWP